MTPWMPVPLWLFLDTRALPATARAALYDVAMNGGIARCGDDPRGALDALCDGAGAHLDSVKIGHSANLLARLQALQTAQSEKLFIYALMPGGRREEKALHAQFAAHRGRPAGEWFRAAPEVMAWCSKWRAR